MAISVLTYNLDINRALAKIADVIQKNRPDIISLQEMETLPENIESIEKLGYKLADYSNAFLKRGKICGNATFYYPKTIAFDNADSIELPVGIYEIIEFFLRRGRRQRTVLQTTFKTKETKRKFVLYNVHLSPYTTNNLRIKQIIETLQELHLNSIPTIILGDFNYPYGRKQLEDVIGDYDLKEATNQIFHTFQSTIRFFPFKLKLDYVLYQNVELVKCKKLNVRYSDHYPIISKFKL